MLFKKFLIIASLGGFSTLSAYAGNWLTQELASKANLKFNDGNSKDMVISPNGRFIAFSSCATTLIVKDTNGKCDIFLKDTQTNIIKLVSNGLNNQASNGDSQKPDIAVNGSTIFVTYESTATNLIEFAYSTSDIYLSTYSFSDTDISVIGNTELISRPEDENITSNNSSFNPSISKDGNRIVFDSLANNLSKKIQGGPDQTSTDTNGVSDVFIRDRAANTTYRINKTYSTIEVEAASRNPVISADGEFVVFESDSNNISSKDVWNNTDIFRYSLAENKVILISLKTNGNKSDSIGSYAPSINADGNVISFHTSADLTNDISDVDGVDDVYVRNVLASTTSLISIGGGEYNHAGGANFSSINADGDKLIFTAKNATGEPLVAQENNVFYRDLSNLDTIVISGADEGVSQNSGELYLASISANGKNIAYNSDRIVVVDEDNDSLSDVYKYQIEDDPSAGSNLRVSLPIPGENFVSNVDSIAMSKDGRYIVIQSKANNILLDGNEFDSLYLLDRGADGKQTQLERLSFGLNGAPLNGEIDKGSFDISDDGNYIVFSSLASNIVSGDTNTSYDVFYHNRLNSSTILISFGQNGAVANGSSRNSRISGDGKRVTYSSSAPNIISHGVGNQEVYVYDADKHENTLVSHTQNGEVSPKSFYSGSTNPEISSDGNFITYMTENEKVFGYNTSAGWQIALYDISNDENSLVTVPVSDYLSYEYSFQPSISSDGRYVAYSTHATDKILGDGVDKDDNYDNDILLYDRQTGTNQIISYDNTAAGVQGNQIKNAFDVTISDDGTHVVFKTKTEDEVNPDVFNYQVVVRDLVNNVSSIVANSNALDNDTTETADHGKLAATTTTIQPRISSDGDIILYPANIPHAIFTLDSNDPLAEPTVTNLVSEGSSITQAYIAKRETDSDIDGIPDRIDTDDDNDGMSDDYENLYLLNDDDSVCLNPLDSNDAAEDCDGDGLSNLEEFELSTKPNDSDSDNDGLTDHFEVNTSETNLFLTNPLNDDSDNDGLTDGYEINTSLTNPLIADSDGDGLSDGYEVNTSLTNPNSSDSDNDGLSDGDEVNIHQTNPNSSDSDNDGLSDEFEVNNPKYDPLNGDMDGDGVLDGSDSDPFNKYIGGKIAAKNDFNNDGKTDLFWHNKQSGQTYVYLMNGKAVIEVGSPTTRADTYWHVVGRGDFNGDGKEDVLWRHQETGVNEIDLMSGVSVTNTISLNTVPMTWQVAGIGDVNGDNADDVIWQELTTDEVHIHTLLNGQLESASQLIPANTDLKIKAVADFNSDGFADLWLRNKQTNENFTYLLNGFTIVQQISLGVISENWQLQDVADVDGDDDSDIVWRNKLTSEVNLYVMQDGSLQSELALPTRTSEWRLAMTGDLIGDLSQDFIWHNLSTGEVVADFLDVSQAGGISSSQTVTTIADASWQLVPKRISEISPSRYDFDGDNKADILIRDSGNGELSLQRMNGVNVISSDIAGTLPVEWQVAGRGDFDGDGKSDLLWRNNSTGANQIHLMDGHASLQESAINSVGTNWEVAGVADFNGDKKDDILWRDQVTGSTWLYTMDGTTVMQSQNVTTISDMNWKVATTPDTNGDGKADILWRNTISGDNYLYLMNGNNIMRAYLLSTVPVHWSITGSGDLNGDDVDDIIFRSSDGTNWSWLMHAGQIGQSLQINRITDTNWRMKDMADFDGDGNDDILWRNQTSGSTYMYLMNGNAIIGQGGSDSIDISKRIVGQ
ncbi:VCBS repeat-containing protein [Litorilituus lipolyticus]|uniref:Uncharacterized protein n=1 Tax=Litorilituus lipolyticus TaxID=2491017 RepID=A0A502L785_9GAMM|nr:FG-GAP-like repeat-containing protein [Litorilituus lipolyticus]TPH18964.1 hypothetical protein EPA86_01320 [Litorilituus lipolyticus]